MHCLRLRAQTISPNETDTESTDASNIDLTIPGNAGVNFFHVDGKPGMLVSARCTKHWTPIAARIRARLTLILTVVNLTGCIPFIRIGCHCVCPCLCKIVIKKYCVCVCIVYVFL